MTGHLVSGQLQQQHYNMSATRRRQQDNQLHYGDVSVKSADTTCSY